MSPEVLQRSGTQLAQPPLLTAPGGGAGPAGSLVWLWAALGGLTLLALGVLHAFPPGSYGFYPRCGLFVITGLHCPGCGSLRALSHLTHGRFLAALDANALLVLGMGAGALWGAARWFRWPAAGWVQRLGGPRAAWAILLVTLLFALLRNLPWYPCTVLAP